ncbi:MAG: 3-deoxy-7-phosphoheptulonate synthase, partial [Selenomonas sp.]|nr:3-deoxy-7-phosphoheptulonate synthase [Selenomonas sp.]
MIVVMNAGATQENIDHVIAKIEQAGLRTHLSKGEDRVIIGVIGDKQLISGLEMNMMEGVEKTVRITEKY